MEAHLSWTRALDKYTSLSCRCVKPHPSPYSGGDGSTTIRCKTCNQIVGVIPKDVTRALIRYTDIILEYQQNTYMLTNLLQKNLTWRIFMTTAQPQSIHEIDSDKVIRLFPGHLVYESSTKREAGETCNHRLVLKEDGLSARCVLCGGTRKLDEDEILAITAAQKAGVIFLQWRDRLRAMEHLRMGGKKRRKKRVQKGKGKTGPSKAVEARTQVPDGYLPVKEAAEKLEMDAKTLRKQIRRGIYQGVKVGGRVYVDIRKP